MLITLGVMEMTTWQDNQPVSILHLLPEFDRYTMPGDQCVAWRRAKNHHGKWFVFQTFHPPLFNFFDTGMGGVDLM